MFISSHKWHREHRKSLFKIIGIQNIEIVIFKAKMHPEHRKFISKSINGIQNIEHSYFKKHKWHPEHRKHLFQIINGIRNIESTYFKAKMECGT